MDANNDFPADSHPPSRSIDTEMPSVSFVVPTMDEQETVKTLVEQIDAVCSANGIRYDVVFVDDGSTDATWHRMEELASQRDNVFAIRFRRNFGKAAALSAGFKAATGDVVITMDADLQDDPVEVPRFLAKLDEGYEVVSGWKQTRLDSWDKVYPSKVFNWLVSTLTGVKLQDHNCGFKAYRREVIEGIQLYGELHRFVPVLAASQGWRVGQIPVVHHKRDFGRSKYGVSRIVKGFLDLLTVVFLTTFGKRPLHFIGSMGLLCLTVGGCGLMYLTAMRIISQNFFNEENWLHLHRSALFYYCITAILLGAQMFLAGLLAELIVSESSSAKHPYAIAESVGKNAAESQAGSSVEAVGT